MEDEATQQGSTSAFASDNVSYMGAFIWLSVSKLAIKALPTAEPAAQYHSHLGKLSIAPKIAELVAKRRAYLQLLLLLLCLALEPASNMAAACTSGSAISIGSSLDQAVASLDPALVRALLHGTALLPSMQQSLWDIVIRS